MKIMLVNPPVFRVEEPWMDTPGFVRTGLAAVAGYMRQYPGFEIKIIDSKYERLDFEKTLKRIVDFEPEVLGMGAFTNEIKPAAYLAKLVKKALPKTIVVIGGVHVTALPDKTLEEFRQFDIGVIGEGEMTFTELCYALQASKPLDNINGLSFRREGKVIVTKPRERILDQDSLPFPAWDLMPPTDYYIVMTQRGCPFNCVFCMNPNGRVARQRSIENVIEELEMLKKYYNPKYIRFGDEIFTVDMDRTKQLLEAILKSKVYENFKWTAQTHVHYVDEELFSLMKKTNVDIVGLGIETGDEEKLKKLGKGTNLKMIMDAREAARKAGIRIETYFIIGQPNETIDSIKLTIDLAVKLNPDLPIFGLMTPYPGTEIARLAALGEGGYRLATTDWSEYNKQIGGALEFADLTRRQIEIIQLTAYGKVFLYNHRYLDFLRFLWQYRVGGWSVLRKVLGFRSKLNYDVEFESRGENSIVSKDDIAKATASWQKWQVVEVGRAKKNAPQSIKVTHRDQH